MKKITKYLLISLSILGALNLASCNTVKGAGKDIQAGGESIERAADNTKKKM